MRNLVCANFARLWKNKLFWGCMIFMAGFGVFSVAMRYRNMPATPPDPVFFFQTVLIGLVAACFCGLFLGTEYSDGAMRNKLIVGHTRAKIYLSNLFVCACAGLMMTASNYGAVALAGIPLLGNIEMPLLRFAFLIFISLTLTVTFCSLFTAIGMNIQSKASASIAVLLMVILLFAIAVFLKGGLDEPEYSMDYTYRVYADGMDITDDAMNKIPNPAYLTGTIRAVYQFFFDALPAGQAIQLSGMSMHNEYYLPVYSFLISIASTLAGMWTYRKKDLK